ncbi:MAG: recombination mediator RecR [Bacteroidota bacterium]|nr:recombination mediator RecR [Bacteroidota bacterium]MDP3145556.1 recombination mediator RecR [Bacteroidota bacterium]
MEFSSKIIEQAVEAFAQLPGVGKKTALRYVLHVIKQDKSEIELLAKLLLQLKTDLKYCQKCHNISEQNICEICLNPLRDETTICVVQDYRDVMAIENTGLYKGHYHVLGGIISPLDGITPSSLNIETLVNKVSTGNIVEVILALNATMEGETTSFYIFRKLAPYKTKLSAIARGIAVGDELEYADEVTLGRSITNRIPFDSLMKK